ncbi:uncharacterized protein LOC126840788 [Adelges cooleyi]|uniref:uncharacterized protein LOC126840788 n=1 Tax=Adelges cooleyi TaxID=133065 RepID=UPI0021807953|nr:uncharacterized protein LOC126840788 [Adelges cooleyi]
MALKCQLFVFVFFLLNSSLALKFTTEIKSHYDNNFDITTVFKLDENNDTLTTCSRPDKSLGITANLRGCYNGEIHLRKNAIGIPVSFNGRVLSQKENTLEFIVDSYYKKNYITNNPVEYNPSYWMFGTEFDTHIVLPLTKGTIVTVKRSTFTA